jgi:hypothetical protein
VSSNYSEYPRVYTIKFTYRLAALPYKVPMRTIHNFLANETRATANEYGLGADEAKSEISAAVRYLLKDAADSARGEIVREIIEIVHNAANGLLPPQHPNSLDVRAAKQPPVSGVSYKAYVIDAFQRDTDNWRATIRRLDGKKIRVAIPRSVRDEFTTSADAVTAEKAVEFAKEAIDGGGIV